LYESVRQEWQLSVTSLESRRKGRNLGEFNWPESVAVLSNSPCYYYNNIISENHHISLGLAQ